MKSKSSKTYRTWYDMIRRCNNEKFINYHRYGGRGISVCERWANSYYNFCDDMGEKPSGLTLDRINNDGNYEPSNCRWATHTEQIRNSSILKVTQLMVYAINRMHVDYNYKVVDIAKIFDVSVSTIRNTLFVKEGDIDKKRRDELLKKITTLRSIGCSLKEISIIFNREKIKTHRSLPWNHRNLSTFLNRYK